MIRLFLDNRTMVLFLLPLIIGTYILASFFGIQEEIILRKDGLFLQHFQWNEWTIYSIQSLFILINAVFLNAVFNSHEFLEKNTYIISLLYVVLVPLFIPLHQFDGTLLVHFFVICVLSVLFHLKQNADGRMLVFNAGALASIGMIFLPYLILWIPILLIMILIIRPFIWRELFLCLAGIAVPIIYFFSYLFFKNQLDISWSWPNWQMHNDQKALHLYPVVVIFSIFVLLSLFSLGGRLLKSSLRLKKQIQLLGFLFAFFILLGIVDFYFSGSLSYLSLAIIPLTYFLTYAFLSKRSGILTNIFFYITLLYSFVKFFISFTGAGV